MSISIRRGPFRNETFRPRVTSRRLVCLSNGSGSRYVFTLMAWLRNLGRSSYPHGGVSYTCDFAFTSICGGGAAAPRLLFANRVLGFGLRGTEKVCALK